jgi:hypothetical protein
MENMNSEQLRIHNYAGTESGVMIIGCKTVIRSFAAELLERT